MESVIGWRVIKEIEGALRVGGLIFAEVMGWEML